MNDRMRAAYNTCLLDYCKFFITDIFVEITYVLPTVNFKLMTHLNLNNNQLVTLPAEMRW